MTETTENLFTEEEQKQIEQIEKHIEENKEEINEKYKNKSVIFYRDKKGQIKTKRKFC